MGMIAVSMAVVGRPVPQSCPLIINRAYVTALDTYEKVLPQRNALLRRIAEKRASTAELAYWDEQLTQSGAIIIAERQNFLRELENRAQVNHHALTGNQETLTLQSG